MEATGARRVKRLAPGSIVSLHFRDKLIGRGDRPRGPFREGGNEAPFPLLAIPLAAEAAARFDGVCSAPPAMADEALALAVSREAPGADRAAVSVRFCE